MSRGPRSCQLCDPLLLICVDVSAACLNELGGLLAATFSFLAGKIVKHLVRRAKVPNALFILEEGSSPGAVAQQIPSLHHMDPVADSAHDQLAAICRQLMQQDRSKPAFDFWGWLSALSSSASASDSCKSSAAAPAAAGQNLQEKLA